VELQSNPTTILCFGSIYFKEFYTIKEHWYSRDMGPMIGQAYPLCYYQYTYYFYAIHPQNIVKKELLIVD